MKEIEKYLKDFQGRTKDSDTKEDKVERLKQETLAELLNKAMMTDNKITENRKKMVDEFFSLPLSEINKIAEKIEQRIKKRRLTLNACKRIIKDLIKSETHTPQVYSMIEEFKNIKETIR
jgi:hypothetical protein